MKYLIRKDEVMELMTVSQVAKFLGLKCEKTVRNWRERNAEFAETSVELKGFSGIKQPEVRFIRSKLEEWVLKQIKCA